MYYCGLKLTHDSSITLLRDNELLSCIEVEKTINNFRHSPFTGETFTKCFERICRENNVDPFKIDFFSVDGWSNNNVFGDLSLNILNNRELKVYGEKVETNWYFNDFLTKVNIPINKYQLYDKENNYIEKGRFFNFSHIYNHLISSYSSSPFSKNREKSYLICWDGGCYPSLYFFDGQKFNFLATLFYLTGNFYKYIPSLFDFKEEFSKSYEGMLENSIYESSLPGKIMAYSSLGKEDSIFLENLKALLKELACSISQGALYSSFLPILKQKTEEFALERLKKGASTKDLITTGCTFLKDSLIDSLKNYFRYHSSMSDNMCLCGGSFLNINYNTSLRENFSGMNIWVPPFTNDSGSSIGAALSTKFLLTNDLALDWNVYKGPKISLVSKENWREKDTSPKEIAALITKGDPIVFLRDNAELGPRALGHRSILCDALNPKTKDLLNGIKQREFYRPIAPVCLEEDSKDYFIPGGKDPYMLFNHKATSLLKEKCPSIVHVDGTCRLQTVNQKEDSFLYEVLKEYKKLSGVSVLANTSVNRKGKGFFDSLKDCQSWCEEVGIRYILGGNKLYDKIS